MVDEYLYLQRFSESLKFKGWDPYDGLNSQVFRISPFCKFRFARLAWIQFFKISPVNFRKILLVPKQHNAKGLGLFLTGYCNKYKIGSDQEGLNKIYYLLDN